MNKCFITQWLLVLYLSLLVGCTKDVTSPEKVGEPISLGLTLDTYAGEDSNAKEHEKAIHNLYVFIYGSDGRLENPDNTRELVKSRSISARVVHGKLNMFRG